MSGLRTTRGKGLKKSTVVSFPDRRRRKGHDGVDVRLPSCSTAAFIGNGSPDAAVISVDNPPSHLLLRNHVSVEGTSSAGLLR